MQEIKSLGLSIDIIATSHGAIWRDDPMQIIEKYSEWSNSYSEDQITVIYDTMWEGTAKLAHSISREISRQSPSTVVKVYNISKSDKNDVMTEIFKSRAIALGSPTVGNNILSSVSGWLTFIKYLRFKNKKAGAFGCYGWSGEGVGILCDRLADAGFDVIDTKINSFWNPCECDLEKVPMFVSELLN